MRHRREVVWGSAMWNMHQFLCYLFCLQLAEEETEAFLDSYMETGLEVSE